MISHATMYKNVILRAHYSLVDNILSSSAIWQNIAITSILYGTHAIPVSSAVIQEIEIIQNQVGKALLGVPQSTANVVIQSELGWLTPIIYTVFNIMDVLGHLVSSPQELMDISVKQLHQEYELATLTQIKEMVILKLLPIPQKWWVRQPHVENPCWSSMNMKFRIMNAGLGNRDAYRTANSVCQDWGRILQCPLCFQGSNNEIHLLTKCEVMVKHRQSIKLRCGLSL